MGTESARLHGKAEGLLFALGCLYGNKDATATALREALLEQLLKVETEQQTSNISREWEHENI